MASDGTGHPYIPSDGANYRARYLAELIQEHFRVELSPTTIAAMRSHLWRVGVDNQLDLVSSIFLECLQASKRDGALTDVEVRRAADRVRHRLTRGAKRTTATDAEHHATAVEMPPDDEAEFVIRQFRELLRRKSAQDVILFERYFLGNQRDVPALSKELNISPATIYRKLAAIRSDYLSLRDLRQPPHGGE